MDKQLADLIKDNTPEFNLAITDGLACEQIKFAMRYLDRVWRCAEGGFPEGLVFVRAERCTPQEEFNEIIRRRNGRSRFELAQSDVYMVKYIFSYHGEELDPRFLYLPFVRDAGLITLRGATFAISPVLSNPIIDVQDNGVFVPLNRAKITFEREFHYIYRNGVQEGIPVVYSEVYNISAKFKRARGKPTIQCKHGMAHYLFCKYGLRETFKKFANTEIEIGRGDVPEHLLAGEWEICSSKQIKPKGVRERYYSPTNIWLAVPTERWNTLSAGLVGGFFYTADHFPNLITVEEVDDTDLWCIAMGHAIFATDSSVGKLIEDVRTHLRSIDTYIDKMAQEEFEREGVIVTDIYQLFVYMIANLPDIVVEGGHGSASMYGKRLSVLRFVLFDIVKSIFTFLFRLSSNTKKVLTKSDIQNIMNKTLRTERIFEITSGHGEVTSISYPGDNKFLKITSNVVQQNENSGRGAKKTNLADARKQLDFSIAEVNQYSNLPKSDPSGRGRINPMLQIGTGGEVIKNPEYADVRAQVQKLIRR